MQLWREIRLGSELGEAVLWHPDEQRVWWTDILGRQLYAYDPQGDALTRYTTPHRLTAFGFTPEPGRLIASFAGGIADYWPATGEYHWRARPESDRPGNRFNDGRVDPAGRFWAGTMVESGEGEAALYRFDGGHCRAVLTGLQVANGLCWSPDGRTAYHADSPSRTIRAFDCNRDGQLANPRVFARTPEGVVPDGACTDAAGNVWSAQWGGARVVCYSPAGEVLAVHPLPVSQPSCVAFGGSDYSLMFVTSARENMSASQRQREPSAGNLLIYRTIARGKPCDFYRGAG